MLPVFILRSPHLNPSVHQSLAPRINHSLIDPANYNAHRLRYLPPHRREHLPACGVERAARDSRYVPAPSQLRRRHPVQSHLDRPLRAVEHRRDLAGLVRTHAAPDPRTCHAALLEFPYHQRTGLAEFPPKSTDSESNGSRLIPPPQSPLSQLTCGMITMSMTSPLPSRLLPPHIAVKLPCTTTDCFDDHLPLLAPPRLASSSQSIERAALTDRWERALCLPRVIELRGVFDAASTSFWSPGGRVKKILGSRDVELVLDKRWSAGVSPLSSDTWVCWLNRENAPRANFDRLLPPPGACVIVANFEWRRERDLTFEPIAWFLSMDEVRRIATAGGDITIVFHVRGEPEALRVMPSAECLMNALAAFLARPKRRFDDDGDDGDEQPTLTLVGLENMHDADVLAMSLDVLEPCQCKNVPMAMWCILRSLQVHSGAWHADRLFHLTMDEWAASMGRHASLMIETTPFAARTGSEITRKLLPLLTSRNA